jgi:hypothetical protein
MRKNILINQIPREKDSKMDIDNELAGCRLATDARGSNIAEAGEISNPRKTNDTVTKGAIRERVCQANVVKFEASVGVAKRKSVKIILRRGA